MHGADDMPARGGGSFQEIICVGSTDHEATVAKRGCCVYSACCIAVTWMNLTLWMRSRLLLRARQGDRRQWARPRSLVPTRERTKLFLRVDSPSPFHFPRRRACRRIQTWASIIVSIRRRSRFLRLAMCGSRPNGTPGRKSNIWRVWPI
jgi:hypothetical protein